MNPIRRALADGRPALGGWYSQPSAIGAELYGKAGFDWVVLDAQHGPLGLDSMIPIVQALALGGTGVVVRVAWNDQAMIMRALDIGAIGVIVPMVSNEEDARRAAAATRYPPRGVRSFGPVRAAYGATDAANDDVVCLVMIETQEGLDQVEAIAATPGVDGLFIGPVDLGLSLGAGADLSGGHPLVRKATDTIIAAADRHGIVAGTLSFARQQAEDLLGRGIRFLTVGSDTMHVMAGARSDLAMIAELSDRFGRATAEEA
jgi:4-hydroxy-2-oxoheptanedioate aldolase